jgi:hypothetical protein
VQQFNSPQDLTPIETLNPDYDTAQVGAMSHPLR